MESRETFAREAAQITAAAIASGKLDPDDAETFIARMMRTLSGEGPGECEVMILPAIAQVSAEIADIHKLISHDLTVIVREILEDHRMLAQAGLAPAPRRDDEPVPDERQQEVDEALEAKAPKPKHDRTELQPQLIKPDPLSGADILRSYSADHITCLECGQRLVQMRSHIAKRHGMDDKAYKAKWGLPDDYPMVAPAFSARRSQLSKDGSAAARFKGKADAVPAS